MPKTTRTFVAITVPEDRAAKIARLQMHLAIEITGVRWVEPKLMHATLAFLGDVPDTDLDSVCRAVGRACRGTGPIELKLESLGVFPGACRPRSLWVAMNGEGRERLETLQKAVAAAVTQAGYPPADGNRFFPHVTLGRVKDRRTGELDISDLINHYRGWSAGSFTVAEIVTFASTTVHEGPIYTPLARVPLTGGKKATQA
ncbi:MAG TPA: RNA 2',3'-cyclic phosphodiesterase [Isosphaeraceae bacterium]|jgi:2'-5' RNA ligase|nr:RNA 2',3'-cyclic phosphodiesterase [Isosphaeraceae bacterium]